ncbi:MAG TPA: hypothetical protein VF434_10990 [Promineifilum sp.]
MKPGSRSKAWARLFALLAAGAALVYAAEEDAILLPVIVGRDIYLAGSTEIEPNNSFAQANGSLVSGFEYNALADDLDDFFYLVSGGPGELKVMVSDLVVSNGHVNLYREVEGGGPPELLQSSDTIPDIEILEDRVDPGKYFVVVHVSPTNALRQASAYKLTVTYSGPATPIPEPEETPKPTSGATTTPEPTPTRTTSSP